MLARPIVQEYLSYMNNELRDINKLDEATNPRISIRYDGYIYTHPPGPVRVITPTAVLPPEPCGLNTIAAVLLRRWTPPNGKRGYNNDQRFLLATRDIAQKRTLNERESRRVIKLLGLKRA